MADDNSTSTTTVLPSPPFDTISSLKYSPNNPDQLLVSSWDTTVRFYQVGDPSNPTAPPSELKSKFDHRAAVLTCAFSDDGEKGYSGGLDGFVRELDFTTEKIANMGSHTDSISTMVWSKATHNLITGSWDRTIRFWDPRAAPSSSYPQSAQTQPQSSTQQIQTQTPERIYAIDLVNYTLVVAMASRLFHIYDIRKMGGGDGLAQQRESSLKFMTRSLSCMPDGLGYATASVEGRIAVEYFDPSPAAQEKKYAFKCHRQTIDDVDHVWPVNALAFHPVYTTFASGGSDATISIWDHKVKKRLRQYPKYPNAISALAFNCDGTKLGVGASYMWDEGEEGVRGGGNGGGTAPPWIGVRKVGDEVRPKGWVGN